MKAPLIALAIGACASFGPLTGSTVLNDGFLAATLAAIGQLAETGAAAHPVQVDPRPITPDAWSAFGALVDDPSATATRRVALAEAGLAEGDAIEAAECGHVGGMGGLMIEPLTEEQKRLIERCARVFRGLTLAVSLPESLEGGLRRYRVLAFGSNSRWGWDIVVDASGAVASVHRFMYLVS